MKVVILAGGLGSRLSEETQLVPKPMVQIGGRPILWHVMKIYSSYGFNEFVILTGYKSYVIKDYFVNYYQRYSDITVDMANNSVEVHRLQVEPWKVTMLYTGEDTLTGGRIKRAQPYIGNEPFLLTYGDGVCDVNIKDLVAYHKAQGKALTLTAVRPNGRFGALDIGSDDAINAFQEKPQGDGNWINGGFMVCEPRVFDAIEPNRDDVIFERGPMETLAKNGDMQAFKHTGFWHAMDTLKDKNELTDLWMSGKAPWAIWRK